jgi:hypothetical protein
LPSCLFKAKASIIDERYLLNDELATHRMSTGKEMLVDDLVFWATNLK